MYISKRGEGSTCVHLSWGHSQLWRQLFSSTVPQLFPGSPLPTKDGSEGTCKVSEPTLSSLLPQRLLGMWAIRTNRPILGKWCLTKITLDKPWQPAMGLRWWASSRVLRSRRVWGLSLQSQTTWAKFPKSHGHHATGRQFSNHPIILQPFNLKCHW